MSNDEIAGRLVALEVFAMTALGLYLANSKNDPDYQKAGALIEHLTNLVRTRANNLPPGAQMAADQYAQHLATELRTNLRNMRGEGGATH